MDTSRAHRVLVVEDDGDVRSLVVDLLERAQYDVSCAGDGRAGVQQFHQDRPDLVVLDISMPELDGFQALERIRDLSDVPVLMLTAYSDELERVRGLKAGADDYLCKPFGRQELIARVRALLRRARDPRDEAGSRYRDDFLEIDFVRRSVTASGGQVDLTPLEFRLLSAFVRHPGRVLSNDQLLEWVWDGADGRSPEAVRLYVSYLRRKLGAGPSRAAPIETVRGFGYRYNPAASQGGDASK